MIRRPPRSTQSRSSAASDVYKRQGRGWFTWPMPPWRVEPHLDQRRPQAGAIEQRTKWRLDSGAQRRVRQRAQRAFALPNSLRHVRHNAVEGNAFLGKRVTIADGDGLVLGGLALSLIHI